MPAQAFGAVEQLKQEQMVGAMSPEARSGNLDASVITGQGVQQLMAGFSSQIASAQSSFKVAFTRMTKLAFEMDEKLFPNVRKDLRGNDNGVPYATSYVASKDIDGDHTVDISYGFAAGMDPNRALVFILQAEAAGLVSKEYARRALPYARSSGCTAGPRCATDASSPDTAPTISASSFCARRLRSLTGPAVLMPSAAAALPRTSRRSWR